MSHDLLEQQSPEQEKRDLVARAIESDQLAAYEFGELLNGTGREMSSLTKDAARKRGQRAADLIDVIDAGGEDAEAAKAELAGIEGEAFGYREATAKFAIDRNASEAGIDYLEASYEEIGDDPEKMVTNQMAFTMARVAGHNQYSDKREESWNFPGFASVDDKVNEEGYQAAVANAYKLAGVERNAEAAFTNSPIPDGKTETVYITPTNLGFSIRESRSNSGTVMSGLIIDKQAA